MSEPATPPERPPYWSDCESMDLPQLGRFIHDALLRRAQPSAPDDGSTPLKRPEFSDLVGLMQAKADELEEDTTMPARPVYDGPLAPPPLPDPTQLLAAARRRRNEARAHLADAYKFRAGQNVVQQRREEVRRAVQAISQIEDEAKRRTEEILRLRDEYRQARERYERDLEPREREVAKVRGRQQRNERRQALVDRSRRKVREAFKPKPAPDMRGIVTRNFEIARPDEQGDEHVRRYYREVVGRDRLEGVFSQDRFEKMLALPRSNWQKGKAGFYGYIVLMFAHTERIVLECPVEGNAIYVLDSNEDSLLAKNKRQLRELGQKRIFHSGNDWYRRLKDELSIE